MKLLQLSLQYFRQHTSSNFSFADGLIGIIGPNGVGKSTIIEAISFALFGSEAIRGKLDDLPTKNESGKNTQVILTFEHDKTIFRVERGISDAKLFSGGTQIPISKGSKDVKLRIQNILSMTYEEFSATFYTEQKSLEFLSQKNGGTQREKFIMRMMGYDKVEKVQERLREDRKEKRNILSGLTSRSLSKEEVQEGIIKEKKELEVLEKELNEGEEVLKKFDKETSEQKKVLEGISAQRDEFLSLQKELLQSEAVYAERTRKVNEFSEKITFLMRKIKDSETIIGSSVSEVLEKYQSTSLSIQSSKENVHSLSLLLRDEQTKVTHNKKDIDAQIRNVKEKLSRITSLGISEERCPTCGQALTSLDDSVKHIESEIFKLNERKDSLDLKSKELIQLEQNFLDAQKVLIDLEHEKSELEPIYKASLENESANKEKKQLEQELVTLRESLKEVHDSLLTVKKKVGEINFSEERFLKERSKYDSANSLLSTMRLERVRKEGDTKGIKGKITEKEELLKRLIYDEAQASAISEKLLVLEEADIFLTDFRKYLVGTLRPRLAEISSKLLTELTDARYTTLEFSEDFLPFIVDEGVRKSVISGGEEDILYLSVRLALSQMLAERAGQDFSLLILDEVFGSLDEVRRQNVLYLLRKLCERFEQIILISHFDDVKDSVDNVISLTLDEQTNRVTVDEMVRLKEVVNI